MLGLVSCEIFKEEVDLIVVNANVYTVDESFSKAEYFAARDSIFLAIGTSEEIQKVYTVNQIIDADVRTITPDLIDAHCHFYSLGQTNKWLI